MKRIGVVLSVLLGIGLLGLAQSEPPQREREQFGQVTMKCPMMDMMSKRQQGQMMGNMKHMMQGMNQRMTNMFALSGDEIAALLDGKKTVLGLSDSQVKEVADLIASSQQQKASKKMQDMMARMQAGEMSCPCCTQSAAE